MTALPNNSAPKSNLKNMIALVLLIVAAVGIFIFLLPKRGEFKDASANLVKKQTELSAAKSKLTSLEAVDSSFKGSEVTQKDVLNAIPQDIEEDAVIKTLAKLADENEVTLNSLSFSTGSDRNTDIELLSITTNVSGKHQDMISFLEALEVNSRKFVVKNISVQTLENFLENMSLSIEAYSL